MLEPPFFMINFTIGVCPLMADSSSAVYLNWPASVRADKGLLWAKYLNTAKWPRVAANMSGVNMSRSLSFTERPTVSTRYFTMLRWPCAAA